VYQNITLYQLAINVLNDTGFKYWIDRELDQEKYRIPFPYFEPGTKKRECLRLIAEASLSQAYVSRNDEIRIEGPSYLATQTNVKQDIAKSRYISKDNQTQFQKIANYVEVTTQPLTSEEVKDVYTSDEKNPETISAGQTKIISVEYSSKPVIDAAVVLVNATSAEIKIIKYYAWGADITVYSANNDTFTIKVTGKPLKVTGSQKVSDFDRISVKSFGKMPYPFAKNHLIQTEVMAKAIVAKCLELSKEVRADAEINFQGNPALELGDLVRTPDTKSRPTFYITSQNISWDGGLVGGCSFKGRRAPSRCLTWDEFDEMRLTWDEFDAKKLTWDQWEVY
jgi:hypothetical protein